MITAAIIRIKHPAVRVPLWVHWWPLSVLGCAVGTIAAGQWRRLFLRDWWGMQAAMFVIGIDGWAS